MITKESQRVPLANEPGIFLNNFTTNEDITTKFEADLPHFVINVTSQNTPVQISLQ